MKSTYLGLTLGALLVLGIFGAEQSFAAAVTQPTSKGTLIISLEPTWGQGQEPTKFKVTFIDPKTNAPHQHQDYDFRILKDDKVVFSAADQTGQQILHNVEGTLSGLQYAFPDIGNYIIQITLNGTGIPATPTEEYVNFPVNVTPEFPSSIIALIAGLMIISAIAAVRLRNSKLTRHTLGT